jgi:flagellar motor switch protein FliG
MPENNDKLEKTKGNLVTQKVAAILLGLGPDFSKKIFEKLSESDIRRIALGARELRKAEPDSLTGSLQEFVGLMEQGNADALVGDDLLRNVAIDAVGEEIARRAFEGVQPPPPPDEVLGPIVEADPESLGMILAREHAQTVALVLSAMGPERALPVIGFLPEDLKPAVLSRMATVDSVAPEVLREVGQALARELDAMAADGMRQVDGRGTALAILRQSPSKQQQVVITEIEQNDLDLAQELKSKLFTFEDLWSLTDRDIQSLIKEFDSNLLMLGLKGASPRIQEKILGNMSSRASKMLVDDMEAMGPIRMSEVTKAQEELVGVVMQLAEQERITIVAPGDQMV